MQTLNIDWDGGAVTARLEGSGPTGILLAHGAGTDQDHPNVAGLRTRLATAAAVMTFNYPYREEGRKAPDRPERLLACHRAAAGRLRREVGSHLVLAGRSMGGRMATMLVAEGEACRAVVVYGYPLHPPGKPERLRVDHLPAVEVPMLFLTGTRDAFARPDLVEEHLVVHPLASVQLIEGADHSFRRRGTSPGEMLDLLAERTHSFLAGLA